jgi:hypothetical protein
MTLKCNVHPFGRRHTAIYHTEDQRVVQTLEHRSEPARAKRGLIRGVVLGAAHPVHPFEELRDLGGE